MLVRNTESEQSHTDVSLPTIIGPMPKEKITYKPIYKQKQQQQQPQQLKSLQRGGVLCLKKSITKNNNINGKNPKTNQCLKKQLVNDFLSNNTTTVTQTKSLSSPSNSGIKYEHIKKLHPDLVISGEETKENHRAARKRNAIVKTTSIFERKYRAPGLSYFLDEPSFGKIKKQQNFQILENREKLVKKLTIKSIDKSIKKPAAKPPIISKTVKVLDDTTPPVIKVQGIVPLSLQTINSIKRKSLDPVCKPRDRTIKVTRTMSMYDYTNHHQHHHHQHQTSTSLSPSSSLLSQQQPSSAGGSEYLSTSKLLNHLNSNSKTTVDDLNGCSSGMNSSDTKQYMNSLAASMASLSNIGNTCYLNSVVYTLRFAPLFLHNLHHLIEDIIQITQKIGQNKAKSSSLGRNTGGLQGSGTRSWSTKDLASVGNSVSSDILPPKSPRQIASEKLHELFQNLYRNEMIGSLDGFHADTFLKAVQGVSSIFVGNQQQDAHEFLMCMLDSIRETCQSLTKFVNDCPDVLLNGYISGFGGSTDVKNDIPPLVPSTPAPASAPSIQIVKSLTFFRKRNKEDKPKNNNRLNSPMKDAGDPSTSSTVDARNTNNSQLNSIISSSGNSNNNSSSNNSCITTNAAKINSNQMSGRTGDDGIEEFHDKCKIKENIKKLGFDFFAEDFEGVTVSSTKCLSCETITEQEETMIDISVPITEYENIERETLDNHQFIQNLCITREHFRSENKYRCEVCIGLTEAIRTVKYKKLPRLLIIQLKRFSGGMQKINSYIPTPFTMQCFCGKCCDLPDKDKLHKYKLYSVITHVGATPSVGHYIAYTCMLDTGVSGNGSTSSGYNEYFNCPKDKRKQQQSTLSSGIVNQQTSSSTSSSGSGEKNNASIVKKMMFGRSKASSSGDVTKNLNGNFASGNSGKGGLANGLDKLHTHTLSCQSLNCCGIFLKNSTTNSGSGSNNGSTINHFLPNGLTEYSQQLSNSNSILNGARNPPHNAFMNDNLGSADIIGGGGYSNNSNYGGGKQQHRLQQSEQIWYMCDDDKITAMSQMEFKDLLSPNSKKIMITPYLLFYARVDVQHQNSKHCG